MALRGEGQKRDFRRARLWYERATEYVSIAPMSADGRAKKRHITA
jgi:TPR repeat protein